MARKERTVKQEWQVVGLSKDHCQREIAEITGLPKTSVHQIQRKYHITMSFGMRISSSMFRRRFDPYKWTLLINHLYWDKGLNLRQTSECLNVSPYTLSRRMEVLGIPKRDSRQCKPAEPYKGYVPKPARCMNCGIVTKPGEIYCAKHRWTSQEWEIAA